MICTLFAGVDFDEDKVDAIFNTPSSMETFCYIFSDSQFLDGTDTCPADLLVTHKSFSINKTIQQETKRSDTKLLSYLLCPNHNPFGGGNINKSSSKMDHHDQSSKELLTSYIHKSDGKKRI